MRVRHAVGIITVQAVCGCETALDLPIVEAAKLGQNLHDTALDVIDLVIRFDSPTEPPASHVA